MIIQPFNLKEKLKEDLTKKINQNLLTKDLHFIVELTPSNVLYGCKKSFNVKTTHFIDPSTPEFDSYFPEYSSEFGKYVYYKFTNYDLHIEEGTDNNAKLVFEGCGNDSFYSFQKASNVIFITKYVSENGVEIIGNDIKVKRPIDIYKVLEGGMIRIEYLNEGFDIEVDEFPDPLIEENKEYTLAGMGFKGKGNLILVFTYDYTNAREKRMEKMMNRLKI